MTVNTLGDSFAGGKSRSGAWLAPLAPIAISIFAISALVSYHLRAGTITPRTVPQSVVIGIYEFLGWVPACMFFGLVFTWSSIWFVAGSIEQPSRKLLRVLGLTLALAVFGNLDASAPHTGALGAWIGGGLSSVLGSFLSHLVMAPLTFLSLLLATDYFWMSYFERRVLEKTQRELHGAGVGTEMGVEPTVPEEFKQLARTMPPEAEADAMAVEDETDVDAYFARLEQKSVTADLGATYGDANEQSIADAAAEDDEADAAADGEPVRLSYFERRRMREEREAMLAAGSAMAADPEIEADAVADAVDSTERAQESEGNEAMIAESDDVEATAQPTEVVATEVMAAAEAQAEASDAQESQQPEPAVFEGLGEQLAPESPIEAPSSESIDAEMPDEEPMPVGSEPTIAVALAANFEIRFEPLFESAYAHQAADPSVADEGEDGAREEAAIEPRAETVEVADLDAVTDQTDTREAASASVADYAAVEASDAGRKASAGDASDDDIVELPAMPTDLDGSDESELLDIRAAVGESTSDAPAEPAVEIPATEPHVSDLSVRRVRGFLAPVVEDPAHDSQEGNESVAAASAAEDVVAQQAERTAAAEQMEAAEHSDSSPDAVVDGGSEQAESSAIEEPLMSIPRPAEPPRQMSLFGASMDETLLREALQICESSRRASATLLQRKLRIDYEQACVVLAQLAQRGMVELEEDGTQARIRS
ncbi:MAG: Ftsk gamma domain [Planctomycetota bacterium]|jgi:hypothetical protein